MGFHDGAYATIWEIKPGGDAWMKGRLSVSRKTDSGGYETDFDEYVMFVGTAAVAKAMRLKPKDRIRLLRVDATTAYDKEKGVKYHNYKVFDFEESSGSSTKDKKTTTNVDLESVIDPVDSGEIDDDLAF